MLDVNEVLAKVDIVNVIQHYLPIQTRGKSLKAVCPFHDDHDPSLSISRDKQIFKCFTCGTSGNAITFVQKYENIPFRDALEKVAVEFAHMEVKREQSKPKFTREELRMFQAHQEANAYANYNLMTEESKSAVQYLNERRLSQEQIKRHVIGYVSDDTKLHEFLNKKGFSDQELRNAGLFNDSGRYVFKNRVTFPVKNAEGYFCGATSRRIKDDGSAKYINSRESPLFQKNSLLYHLPEAIKDSRRVILVEGTLDVAGLERIGINQGIASLGTALTKEHAQLLKQLRCQVTLCYDGDNAGRKATIASYHILKDVGIEPQIAILDHGMDPDELSLKDPDRLANCLKVGNNIFDFYLKTMPEFENFNQKKEFILNYMKDLGKADLLMQEEYLGRLSEHVRMDINVLREQLRLTIPEKNCSLSFNKTYKNSPGAPKNQSKEKHVDSKQKEKALIHQQVKEKMEFKKEITRNYDRLKEANSVIAFDQSQVLQRNDILEKYLYLRGPVLETQITMLDKDHADFQAQAVCEEAVNVICENNQIAKANATYIAYLHKDTKYPHIHLQVWQKEPYLAKYKIDNTFYQNLKKQINDLLLKPIDLKNNPLIAQELEMQEESIPEAITIN